MSVDSIKQECRNKEFYTYGTHRLFDARARTLRQLRSWITFLGMATPLFVGGVVSSFGTDFKALPYLIWVMGGVGLIQLLMSAFSIVFRWDERYEYALESSRANTELYNGFKYLADNLPPDLEAKYKDLVRENESREFKDLGQAITDKDMRFANHASLKYHRKACHVCEVIPISSKPSKCDSCGNF
ncbi:mobilome CxxCx(11)CxxC protein [Pseudomonas caspiana]